MLEHLPVGINTQGVQESIMKGGFYTVSLKKGFRLIVMNDNVCLNRNW